MYVREGHIMVIKLQRGNDETTSNNDAMKPNSRMIYNSFHIPFVEGSEALLSRYPQYGVRHAAVSRLLVEHVQLLSLHLEPCLCCINGECTCIIKQQEVRIQPGDIQSY